MEGLLREGERLDDLQRGGYRIIQSNRTFCFGLDAVLLSSFARVREGEEVLDLGTGTGVIPLLLKAKTKGRHFTGLELGARSADMARRSVAGNHLEESISIVRGDIREAGGIFPAGSFDVVTSNPPYMPGGHGLVNPDEELAGARHEIWCTLEDVVCCAGRLLRERGRFYLVHRPFRLAEILEVMSRFRLEPKRLRLVYPYADRQPNMLLVEGLKGGRPRMTVEKPLIVYEAPGRYTPEVRRLYDEEPQGETMAAGLKGRGNVG